MYRKTSRTVEPIVVFILLIITVMEFLIYGGGIATGEVLSALNAMIMLMLFGSSLIMITVVIRIYELIMYFGDKYTNSLEEIRISNALNSKNQGSNSNNSKNKNNKTTKKSKKTKAKRSK